MQKKQKTEPIICGIDIGAWTVKVGCYDGQKFEILTNQANFRETPSLVAFTPLQRMIGESANIKMKSNFANTIRSPMRLIGLGKIPHFIEEQLKYSTVNYEIEQSIEFRVKQGDEQLNLQPQQILMALMSKVKQIVSHHNFHIYAAFIAIPSYLSNSQRVAVRKCAQVIKLGQVHLVDDWVSVSSEYSYFRIKQLQEENQRNVIFIDVGYSKFSIYAVQFTPSKCLLIDYEHLKYTGSKNMDNHLTQFYDDMFYKQTKEHKIITSNKALVKLKQMIQKQRKVLSANSQHHLNIEYIMNEQDLNYNMKRQQFEDIIMPVLSQMASALNNIKNRVGPKLNIHSIELLGGASRIPLIQQIVGDSFGIEPSKTLNSSEAMARGASIFGAIETGFINFPYEIVTENFAAVSVVWNNIKNDNYLGENAKAYPNKKVLFDWGCKYPCQSVINLGPQGVVQMFVHYQHQITSQSIGYLRVNTPNKVVFAFDKDKIISAKCLVGGLLLYNFHQIKQQKWHKMQKVQKQFQQNDKRITTLYNLRNQFESLIYKFKEHLQTDWNIFTSMAEKNNIKQLLVQSEKWIEVEHDKKIHSQNDIVQYTNRIDNFNNLSQMIRNRKRTHESVYPQYQDFLAKAQSKRLNNPNSRGQLQQLVESIQKAYKNMQRNLFQTQDLKPEDIKQANRKMSRLM